MQQVIVGGYYDALNVSATEYNVVNGGFIWDDDADDVAQVITTPGKLKNLRVKLDGVPGTGTYTFTLYRRVGLGAWGDTTLTCTVAADGTAASDTEHEVTVAAGDVIALKCVPDSPDDARYARWSMMFEGDNAKESLLLTTTFTSTVATRYAVVGVYGQSTTEDYTKRPCPTSGKIKNLYVQLENDPGTAPDAYRFTLRVNEANSDDGEGNPLQCTVTANEKTGNDTTHEITVAAGDLLDIMFEPLNEPAENCRTAIGMTFVADTDGESLIFGGSEEGLSVLTTKYLWLATEQDRAWTATEAETYQVGQVCVLKNLYVKLNQAPGAGNSYTFKVRLNAADPDGGLTVAIVGDVDVTGNDTVNTVTVAADDELDMKCSPDSTPTVNKAYWGLVCFISPATNVTIEPPLISVTSEGKVPSLSLDRIFSAPEVHIGERREGCE